MQSKKSYLLMSLLVLAAPLAGAADSTDMLLKKLDERVMELEAQSALQRFTFSGVMINRYEALNNRYDEGAGSQEDQVNLPSLLFAFNTDVNVSKRVKLYSTIGMSKYWGNASRNGEAVGAWDKSEQGSFGFQGNTPQFDRVYATYSFDFPLTLAVGRMPTNQGMPMNQLDGLPRQGTYPRMAFNGIFDGSAAIYDWSRLLPEGSVLKTRFFYTPWSNVNPNNRNKQLQDTASTVAPKITSSTQQFQFLVEYSNKKMGQLMSSLDFEYMLYYYWKFYWDGLVAANTGSNNPGNSYYDGRAQTLYLGLNDIAGLGLSASASGLFVWSLCHDTGLRTTSAAYLLSANQKIKALADSLVGLEYINTDLRYYLDEWTYNNLIPFYKTPLSHGLHVYYSLPLGDRLTARVGRYNLETGDLTATGATTRSASQVSYYGQVRIDF